MVDGQPDTGAHGDRHVELDSRPSGVPAVLSWVPKLGIGAWSFVGFVVAMAILFGALGAVSEIVLPMTFAAVLAVIFKPLVGVLKRHRFKPSYAAGLIVLGLGAVTIGVVIATVRGILEQTDQISASVDAAIDNLAGSTSVDQAALDQARAAIEGAEPMVTGGFVTKLVEGVSSLVGLASGLILGALIMYYLLKDGTSLRRSFVARIDPRLRDEFDDFIGDSCRSLRDYGRGRTIMSAIVAVFIGLVALLMGLPLVFTIIVANFIGGYIPYIGAFLGGGLAVIVALGDGGMDKAVIMLIAVAASNLLLENFVEPKVMGRTLDIHPLVVLVVTALGGLLGGIVGLILAVPAWVIASDGISRLRSKGVLDDVAAKAQPTLQAMLD
ncbi:MAG TPA: AI-2E family transporter [Propionibacteriaceae bacterium]|nr:AI-2E family transporter [Propionibacteriaceae bacterium]